MPGGRSIRRIVLAACLLLALVALVPIKMNRYRKILVEAISAGLGRPVSVGDVSLRLFPNLASR